MQYQMAQQQFLQQNPQEIQGQAQLMQQRQVANQPQQPPLAPLNYEKIKSSLLTSNETVKVCATLQAFRWRLTKTRKKKST